MDFIKKILTVLPFLKRPTIRFGFEQMEKISCAEPMHTLFIALHEIVQQVNFGQGRSQPQSLTYIAG